MINCPKCGGLKISPHGLSTAGTQRYKCLECQKTFTLNPKKAGPPTIADRAMTDAERSKKLYDKKKAQFKRD